MRDLKKALSKFTAQTKVNLRKAAHRDEVARITEVQNPSVTMWSIGGGQVEIKLLRVPGEGPFDLGRCNYDTLSPKLISDD